MKKRVKALLEIEVEIDDAVCDDTAHSVGEYYLGFFSEGVADSVGIAPKGWLPLGVINAVKKVP